MDASLITEIRKIVLQLSVSSNGSQSKEIEEIKKQVQVNVDDIRAANIKLDGLGRQIADISNSISTIESRLGEMDNRLVGISSQVTQLSNSVSQNTQSISSLGDRINAVEPRVDSLDTVTSNLTGRTSTLEADVGSLRTELAALTTRVTTEVTRLDGLINSGQNSIGELSTRLSNVETSMVTTAGRGLQKNGNTLNVIVGNGMWFNSSNQLQLDLSGQSKGVGFVGTGMVVKIDTNYFAYNSNGEITLVSQINELPSRVSTLEQSYVASAVTPLRLNSSTKVLDMLIDSSTLEINSSGQLTVRSTSPNLRYPIADVSGGIGMSPNYRFRQSMWIGIVSYSGSGLNWRVQVNSDIFIVDDYIHICLPAFDGFSIADGGDLSLNFVTGLLPPLLTGDTEPAFHNDVVTYGAQTVAIGLSSGGAPQYMSKNLWVEQWQDGVLRLRVEGGGSITHSNSKWPAMTVSYPRSFT
nr:sigma1 [synthetic construct]